jgi:hypothetical protein
MKPFVAFTGVLILLAALLNPGMPAGATVVDGGGGAAGAGVDVEAITIVSGNNQTSQMPSLGSTTVIFQPLVVKVTGAGGAPVPGAAIYFGCNQQPLQFLTVTYGLIGAVTATSDGNGIASSAQIGSLRSSWTGKWTCSAAATAKTSRNMVFFQNFAIQTIPRFTDKLTIVSASSMTAAIRDGKPAAFGPLSVSDKDPTYGSIRTGTPITFACTTQSQYAHCPAAKIVATDSSGTASLTGYSVDASGTYTITVTGPSGTSVAFTLLVPAEKCTPQQVAAHQC